MGDTAQHIGMSVKHTRLLPVPLEPISKKEWFAPGVSAVLLSMPISLSCTSCNLGRSGIELAAVLCKLRRRHLRNSMMLSKELSLPELSGGPAVFSDSVDMCWRYSV